MMKNLTDFAPDDIGKYSPNLHRWLKRFVSRRFYKALDLPHPQVLLPSGFKDLTALMLIGYYDPDDRSVFIGARLGAVITDPFPRGKDVLPANVGAYVDPSIRDGQDKTEWFWATYAQIGRCIFDPDHHKSFIGDEDRYTRPNDQMRTCNWCGTTQLACHREIVKTRIEWENLP